MAPTVDLGEIYDRPCLYLEDRVSHLTVSTPYLGEKRKNVKALKRPYRHKKIKLIMGLMVDECVKSVPHTRSESQESAVDLQHVSMVTITLRTLALLRRNQQLQQRLSLLQAETNAFVESIINTPPSHLPPHTPSPPPDH